MNAAKVTLTATVLAAALGLALGLAPAPAEAHHSPDHTKGGPGGDGGGETPTIVTTEAQWGGDITESLARPCVAAQVKTNGDYGSYVCEQQPPDPANQVTYNLGVGMQTARNGDASLCDVFDGVDLTPNRQYLYAWFDNCGDESCSIQIINWFGGQEVIDATGEKADFISLVAWAEAVHGVTGTIDDPNPFTNSHTLSIDEITIRFTANGSHKKIATCEYSPAPDEVIFQSDPTE